MKKIYIIFLMLFSCCFCHAQKHKVDSLLAQIEKTYNEKKIDDITNELTILPQGNIALFAQQQVGVFLLAVVTPEDQPNS